MRYNVEKILEALKKYLEDNGTSRLAAHLGYREGSTVRRWIRMGSVPEWQLEHLIKYLQFYRYYQ